MKDREYRLYCAAIKGLEPARRNLLLETLGSPEEIYKAPEHVLRGIPLLEDHHISRILAERNVDFEAEAERMDDLGIRFISSDEEGFPERLTHIPDAPQFLFYKGELPKEKVQLLRQGDVHGVFQKTGRCRDSDRERHGHRG